MDTEKGSEPKVENKLISAETLLHALRDDADINGTNFAKVKRHIENTPAVEVVRCKDCRHLEITGCYGECKRGYMGIVKPWDFCSYGERREGE